MIDQETPFGALQYKQIGTYEDGTPRYSAVTTLSQAERDKMAMQDALQMKTGQTGQMLLDNAQGFLSKPIDMSNLPGVRTVGNADESARTAALARILARANPELDRQRETIEGRLASQGINVGSEAYSNGVGEFNRARNDFTLGADIQAGDEMSRLFGLNLAGANFDQQQRQNAINERLIPRNTTINELAALTGGNQVQMPQWASTPQTGVQPADITGPTALAYQGQLNAYNQANQSRNAMMGGLFGLGGSAISAAPFLMMGSDRRIKTDISEVGRLNNGLPVYTFRYKAGGPPQIGLMAQDVEKVNPRAVAEIDGVKHVNYAMAVQ